MALFGGERSGVVDVPDVKGAGFTATAYEVIRKKRAGDGELALGVTREGIEKGTVGESPEVKFGKVEAGVDEEIRGSGVDLVADYGVLFPNQVADDAVGVKVDPVHEEGVAVQQQEEGLGGGNGHSSHSLSFYFASLFVAAVPEDQEAVNPGS